MYTCMHACAHSSLAAGLINAGLINFQLVSSLLYYLPLPRDVRLLLAGEGEGEGDVFVL